MTNSCFVCARCRYASTDRTTLSSNRPAHPGDGALPDNRFAATAHCEQTHGNRAQRTRRGNNARCSPTTCSMASEPPIELGSAPCARS
jgi:hypothetical protein